MHYSKYNALIALLTLCTHVFNFGMEPIRRPELSPEQRQALGLYLANFQEANTKKDMVYILLQVLKKNPKSHRNKQLIKEILLSMNFEPTPTRIYNFIKEYDKEKLKAYILKTMPIERHINFLQETIRELHAMPADPLEIQIAEELLQEFMYSGG